MRVIATSTLVNYWQRHLDTEQPLKAWLFEVKKANWQSIHNIKAQYKTASILKNRRVVFNIKGNHHRLVVAIAFQLGAVYIKFIGTHQEYDQIDVNLVE